MLLYIIKVSYWNCRMILNWKLVSHIKIQFQCYKFFSSSDFFFHLFSFFFSLAKHEIKGINFNSLLYLHFIAETITILVFKTCYFVKLFIILSFASKVFSAVSWSGMEQKKLKNLNWNYIATFHDRKIETT